MAVMRDGTSHHANLPSRLVRDLVTRVSGRETHLQLSEHLLQLGELACAKTPRDLRIDRFRGLALDQIARLEIAQDARQAWSEQKRGAREFRDLGGINRRERAENAPL